MSRFFYTCPTCGADSDSKAVDCCDYCILTIFMEQHAPDFDTMLRNFNSVGEWNEAYEQNPDRWKEDEED